MQEAIERINTMTSKPRVPANTSESDFYQNVVKYGWFITKRGWPDFFCLSPAGRLVVVEVKPTLTSRLKKEQRIVLDALAQHGIEVRISDGKHRSIPYLPSIHASRELAYNLQEKRNHTSIMDRRKWRTASKAKGFKQRVRAASLAVVSGQNQYGPPS